MNNRRHNPRRTVEMLVTAQVMKLEREQALERQQRQPADARRTARPEVRRPTSDRPTLR